MRFAVFCAVSTIAQTRDDKVSLEVQESECVSLGTGRGWIDTGLRYIVPGVSRTRWIDIGIAQTEIPQLKTMLDDANPKNNKYDVLLVYNLNRFRELQSVITYILEQYGVQVYSLVNPIEPVDRAVYSPYKSDAATIMQGMAQIISRVQINDLRRKRAEAMPRRAANRGLHPNNIPYGYHKPPGRETDRNAVAVQDPAECALLVQMKDAYLSGKPVKAIREICLASGLPAPRSLTWNENTIKRMLVNPFYAGITQYGLRHRVIDPRTGKVTRVMHAQPIVKGDGKHEPLWSKETYAAILREHESRSHGYVRRYNRPLTSLLHCPVCDAVMYATYHGRLNWVTANWACSKDAHHIHFRNTWAIEKFTAQFIADLTAQIAEPFEPPATSVDAVRLAELQAQRSRLEDAYQSGALALASFLERTGKIDGEISRLELMVNAESSEAALARENYDYIQAFAADLDALPALLKDGDGAAVNHALKRMIQKVVITADGKVTITPK